MFGAVRKQDVGSAGGTQSNFRDIFRGNFSVQQLPAVRFGEIEKDLLWQLAAAGRSRDITPGHEHSTPANLDEALGRKNGTVGD